MAGFLWEILPKILQSYRVNLKCNKFSGKTLRCHYQSLTILQTSQKEKFWFLGEYLTTLHQTIAKICLILTKLPTPRLKRMKSKRSGKDLFFIKIKCDNVKQAEALISEGLVCQKTGIIFKVEEFRTTPSIQQCFNCQGFEHKASYCTKNRNVLCGEAHSHKNCPTKEKRSPKCANRTGPHVANYRGCPAYKDQSFRQHVVQNQVSYSSILNQASPSPLSNTFNFTVDQTVSLFTNVVIQVALPQLCTKSLPEKQVHAKSDLSKQIAETAKNVQGQHRRQRRV